jgi:diguanylate cyclase (GGDEF)-like protein
MTTAVLGRAALSRPRLRVPRTTLSVLAMSAVLGALGILLALPWLSSPAYLGAFELPWWVLAVGFGLAESCSLHVQKERETQSISLSELPLVVGLFLAAPAVLCLGRLVGLVGYVALQRGRLPALKAAFNLSLALAETGVALAVFGLLTAAADGLTPLSWGAAFVAAFAANALGAMAVVTVISLFEGGLSLRVLLTRAVTGQAAVPFAVTVGLIAVVGLSADPVNAWLLAAFAGVALIGFRAYAALAERHLHLGRLYRFSDAVSRAADFDAVMASVLGEARELLHADRAAAVFLGTDGAVLARVRMDADGTTHRGEDAPSDHDGWLIRQLVDGGGSVLLPRTARGAARRWLDEHGVRDAVAVPMRNGSGLIGALVVAERRGDVRGFQADDVQLLETVANHAGIALQNGELIGKLQHEALHDALTGLPNRAQLKRRLDAALEDVRGGRSPGAAVMILDLDGFKDINDTLGHEQGDQLLVEVAARLASAVGQNGVVARLGGDEFAVLVTATSDEDRVLHIGRRVLRALEQPVALDGLEVEVGGSVGVALAPLHAAAAPALLKRADMAMYDAKTSARRLRLFEPELDSDNPRRLTLVAELRSALQTGAVTVHVQPNLRLATGEVVGVEALARWQHPTLGNVPPDEFIPIAERSGLIGPLTTAVLDTALAACAAWRAAGCDLSVAVNLSARSLHDADLVDEVARLLRRHDVPAGRLTLEVTESAVMADPGRAVALLHQLRDLGVHLSVDDFGTGYSSLSYLKRLPVHQVKIDRSFVTSLGSDADDLPIVRAIVDLGRHMGLEVVAEGVEDAPTMDLLDAIGCDLAQGWHIARPMPVDHLLGWLAARTPTAARARGPLRLV